MGGLACCSETTDTAYGVKRRRATPRIRAGSRSVLNHVGAYRHLAREKRTNG